MMFRLPNRIARGGRVLWTLAVCAAVPVTQQAQPAEVSGVGFTAASKSQLQWDATAAATEYRVYQGDRASLSDLAGGIPDTLRIGTFGSTDTGPVLTADPAPGDFHWFLVTAANASGAGTAGAGRTLDPWNGCGTHLTFADDFPGANGANWPSRWSAVGGVNSSNMLDGWARLRPTLATYSLARMYAHASERDVEALFTFQFEDHTRQGVGFYVRQNRGFLNQTVPTGQGYAVFLEDFRCGGTGNNCDRIGLWKEENGNEIPFTSFGGMIQDSALNFQDNVPYRVRFRCEQINAGQTRLRARFWIEGQPEPTAWQVDYTDNTPVLQNTTGGIVVDSWNSYQTGGTDQSTLPYTRIRDIQVRRLCNPLEGATPIGVAQTGLQFGEGPLWRNGQLYFTDLTADTISTFAPPGPAATWRDPAQAANGLANDVDGDLLACEHESRSVSRTDGLGNWTTLVDNFGGLAFNSPNDLAVRGDGTLYFTDPRFGMQMLGNTSELGYAGLFRRAPGGTLALEWSGDLFTTGPNGVALAPGHGTLYMSQTDAGQVFAFPVAADGDLGAPTLFAGGFTTPDGMCMDMAGNVYVATWGNAVRIHAPDGTLLGSIAVPEAATNCAFGGADRRTLFITGRYNLYSLTLTQPGLP